MYIDDWGLVNSKPDEEYAENSILWTLEAILLGEQAGEDMSHMKGKLYIALKNCRISEGIYSQNPHYTNNPETNLREQYMSPDQLLVFMATYKLWGWEFGKEIWEEIKRQGGIKYDNVRPNSPERFIHPKHLAFAAICASSPLGVLLAPVLAIGAIVSCLAPKTTTSGKILTWVQLTTIRWNLLFSLCTWIVQLKHKNWYEVFKIYFPLDDHPCANYAKKIYDDGE